MWLPVSRLWLDILWLAVGPQVENLLPLGADLWLGVEPHESVAPSFLKLKQNGGSHGGPRDVTLYI